jgi:hypothetical protein
MKGMEDVRAAIAELQQQVAFLQAEAEARRLLARYMFLCDSPLPEAGMPAEARADAIGALFTEDAIWQGVGARTARSSASIAARPRSPRTCASSTPPRIRSRSSTRTT